MKNNTVCFTGHRQIPVEDKDIITQRLERIITDLISRGYCNFYAGGALGFDTVAAQTVLQLKEKYPEIKLLLALPCISQTSGWPVQDVTEYERIKSLADEVVYTSERYFSGCMHKRNRYLADNSSICICYLTRNSGGTAYTVKYADSKGLRIINVAEKM